MIGHSDSVTPFFQTPDKSGCRLDIFIHSIPRLPPCFEVNACVAFNNESPHGRLVCGLGLMTSPLQGEDRGFNSSGPTKLIAIVFDILLSIENHFGDSCSSTQLLFSHALVLESAMIRCTALCHKPSEILAPLWSTPTRISSNSCEILPWHRFELFVIND